MVKKKFFQFMEFGIVCISYFWCRLQYNLLCSLNFLNSFTNSLSFFTLSPSGLTFLVFCFGYFSKPPGLPRQRTIPLLCPISEYHLLLTLPNISLWTLKNAPSYLPLAFPHLQKIAILYKLSHMTKCEFFFTTSFRSPVQNGHLVSKPW